MFHTDPKVCKFSAIFAHIPPNQTTRDFSEGVHAHQQRVHFDHLLQIDAGAHRGHHLDAIVRRAVAVVWKCIGGEGGWEWEVNEVNFDYGCKTKKFGI